MCSRDLKALDRAMAVEMSCTTQWDREEGHEIHVSVISFVPKLGNRCHFLEFAFVFQTLELIPKHHISNA